MQSAPPQSSSSRAENPPDFPQIYNPRIPNMLRISHSRPQPRKRPDRRYIWRSVFFPRRCSFALPGPPLRNAQLSLASLHPERPASASRSPGPPLFEKCISPPFQAPRIATGPAIHSAFPFASFPLPFITITLFSIANCKSQIIRVISGLFPGISGSFLGRFRATSAIPPDGINHCEPFLYKSLSATFRNAQIFFLAR
jgi:hypothetical protein